MWGRNEQEARDRAAVQYGVTPDSITLTQGDPSLLSTSHYSKAVQVGVHFIYNITKCITRRQRMNGE